MCRGSIEQCTEHFRQMRATRRIPDCFQIVATAQCSSEQSVPRAELEAAVTALEAYPGATVYTDCESVVKIWESTRLKMCQVLLGNSSNADLVKRLLAVVQCPGQNVVKVKAHVDPLGCTDDWTGFLQLGNQIADEAAKAALRAIPSDLTEAARKTFTTNKAKKIKLEEVLGYTAKVTIAYLQKCQAKADEEAGLEPNQDPTQKLLCWMPPAVRRYEFHVPDEDLANYTWGTAYAQSLCTWIKTLQWPTGKHPSDPGITILELLVNWLICSGMEQPAVVPHEGKGPYAIQTSQQNPAVALLPYPWPKRVIAFDMALRQLQKLVTGSIMPWEQKADVKCLMKFGPKKPQKGFVRRPILTFASETLQCIINGFVLGSDFKLEHNFRDMLEIPLTCHVQMTPEELTEQPFERFKRRR